MVRCEFRRSSSIISWTGVEKRKNLPRSPPIYDGFYRNFRASRPSWPYDPGKIHISGKNSYPRNRCKFFENSFFCSRVKERRTKCHNSQENRKNCGFLSGTFKAIFFSKIALKISICFLNGTDSETGSRKLSTDMHFRHVGRKFAELAAS